MSPSARGLLLLLLPTIAAAACGGDDTTSTSSTGAGGAAGAPPVDGTAGAPGKSNCGGSETSTGEAVLCYGADGKSDTIERLEFEGGSFQQDCPALVREPGSACPTNVAPCGYRFCGTIGNPSGPPTLVADRCCFALHKCSRPNACGRPLLVEDAPRLADLVRALGWS